MAGNNQGIIALVASRPFSNTNYGMFPDTIDARLTSNRSLYILSGPDHKPAQALWDIRATKIEPTLVNQLKAVIKKLDWYPECLHAGRTEDEARLTTAVLVRCLSKSTMNKVRTYVDESEWLKTIARDHGFAIFVYKTRDHRGGFRCQIRVPLSAESLCGQPITVSHTGHPDIDLCTFGGTISINSISYGLVALHGFERRGRLAKEHDEAHSEDEISASDDDRPSTFNYNVPVTQTGGIQVADRLQHAAMRPPITGTKVHVAPIQTKITDHLVDEDFIAARLIILGYQGNPTNERFNLSDWALVDGSKLPRQIQNLTKSNRFGSVVVKDFWSESSYASGAAAIGLAGKPFASGILSDRPVYFPISDSFLRVQTVDLDYPLPLGSSGAWVVISGYLAGFTVGTVSDMPRAYVVPIKTFLTELRSLFNDVHIEVPTATLPGDADVAPNPVPENETSAMEGSHSLASGLSQEHFVPSLRVASPDPSFIGVHIVNHNTAVPSLVKKESRTTSRLRGFIKSVLLGARHRQSFRERWHDLHSPLSARAPRASLSASLTATQAAIQGDELARYPQHKTVSIPRNRHGSNASPVVSRAHSDASISAHDFTVLSRTYSNASISAHDFTGFFHNKQDHFWTSTTPPTPECSIYVTVDSDDVNTIIHLPTFAWFDKSSTQTLQQVVADRVFKARATQGFESESFVLKKGFLVVQATGGRSRTALCFFDDLDLLQQLLTREIGTYAHNHLYVAFTLNLRLDFLSLRLQTVGGEALHKCIMLEMARHEKTNFQGKRFLPRAVVVELTRQSVVESVLKSDESLASLSSQARMRLYLQAGFEVTELFLACIYLRIPMSFLYHLMTSHEAVGKTWTEVDRCKGYAQCSFFENQIKDTIYRFCAPTITATNASSTNILSRDEVMPIEPAGGPLKDVVIGMGGFGTVYRVSVDASHFYVPKHAPYDLALKRFRSFGRFASESASAIGSFIHEVKVLHALAAHPHPHIVVPIASWTQEDDQCILFPLAKMDLRALFMQVEPPSPDAAGLLWLLQQLCGLAGAVDHVHHLSDKGISGYHHDIKPENVLLFEDLDNLAMPKFMLTDFGTARLTHESPGNLSAKTERYRGSLDYAGPDMHIYGRVSRPADMWALGCVFLEILIWMCIPGAAKALQDLMEQRLRESALSDDLNVMDTMFWFRTPDSAVALKPTVREALDRIQYEYCKNMSAFQRLITLVRELLQIDPSARLTASYLHNELQMLVRSTRTELQRDKEFYVRLASDNRAPHQALTYDHELSHHLRLPAQFSREPNNSLTPLRHNEPNSAVTPLSIED